MFIIIRYIHHNPQNNRLGAINHVLSAPVRPVVHLSMWDRKNCQNTALAGDKQYVPGPMNKVPKER